MKTSSIEKIAQAVATGTYPSKPLLKPTCADDVVRDIGDNKKPYCETCTKKTSCPLYKPLSACVILSELLGTGERNAKVLSTAYPPLLQSIAIDMLESEDTGRFLELQTQYQIAALYLLRLENETTDFAQSQVRKVKPPLLEEEITDERKERLRKLGLGIGRQKANKYGGIDVFKGRRKG